MKRVDLSINNPILQSAQMGFDTCMKLAVAKAVETGSDEGSVTLTVKFLLERAVNSETGEIDLIPDIKFKAGYSVPMKESMQAEILDHCRLVPHDGKWLLVNNQISMDELLEEEDEEGA